MAELPGLALQEHQLSDQVSRRAGGTRGQNAELQVTCAQSTTRNIAYGSNSPPHKPVATSEKSP